MKETFDTDDSSARQAVKNIVHWLQREYARGNLEFVGVITARKDGGHGHICGGSACPWSVVGSAEALKAMLLQSLCDNVDEIDLKYDLAMGTS